MFDLFGQGNLFAQPAQEELSPEEHRHRHEEFLARQQQALEPRPYTGKVQPFYRNGTLVEQEGQYGHLKDISRRQPMFHPLRLNTMQRFRAEAYLPLRDTYHQLYRLEARNETEYRGLRRKLGRLYDNFVRTVGDLNGKENAKLILQDATAAKYFCSNASRTVKNASPISSRAPCRSLRTMCSTSIRLSRHSRRRSTGTAASICLTCPV